MDRAILLAERDILLVEDSPEDAQALMRAFRQAGISNPVIHLADGDAALAHVRGLNEATRPVMVVLDLNLPGTDGREVLTQLKADQATRDIPILVLTSSANERDVEACYRSGANSYLQKPVDYHSLLRTAETILRYWFQTVLVPPVKGYRS